MYVRLLMGLKMISAVATRQLSFYFPASLVIAAILLTMIATLGGWLPLALSIAAIEFSSSSSSSSSYSSLLSQTSVLGTCILSASNTQGYSESVLLHYYHLTWGLH